MTAEKREVKSKAKKSGIDGQPKRKRRKGANAGGKAASRNIDAGDLERIKKCKPKKETRGAPKGSKNAATSFLYAKGIHPDEWEMVERLRGKQANLDDVVLMLQVKLQRAVQAQAVWEEQAGVLRAEGKGDVLPVDERQEETTIIQGGEGLVHKTDREKVFRRRRDFGEEIRALSRLICEITLRQAELQQLMASEDIRSQLSAEIRKDAMAGLTDLEADDAD